MPKLYHYDISKINPKNWASPMNDREWFASQQDLLLWIAQNEPKMLSLESSSLKTLTKIGANYLQTVNDEGQYVTEIRSSDKYSNVVGYHWDWFCELAREFYAKSEEKRVKHSGLWSPVVLWAGMQAGDTSTFYPDAGGGAPGPVSDGHTLYFHSSGVSYSTIHGYANGTAVDHSTDYMYYWLDTDNENNKFNYLHRPQMGFDSSDIGDNHTISAATLSIQHHQHVNIRDIDIQDVNLHIVQHSPALTWSVSPIDYANHSRTSFGSVALSSIGSYAWADFTLNSSGLANISKTGISSFGLLDEWDLNSSFTGTFTQNVRNYMAFRTADYTGTGSDPKLVVTHASPDTPKIAASSISVGLI